MWRSWLHDTGECHRTPDSLEQNWDRRFEQFCSLPIPHHRPAELSICSNSRCCVSEMDVFRTSEEWTAVIYQSEFWILSLSGSSHKLYTRTFFFPSHCLFAGLLQSSIRNCFETIISIISSCIGWKTKEKWSASNFLWGTRYWLCRELWRVW